MKRDINLILAILSAIEEDETASGNNCVSLNIPDYSQDEIIYHVRLLCDAEMIVAEKLSDLEGTPKRLTWRGHEFLDSARDASSLEQVKKKAEKEVKKAPGLTFEVLKQKLINLALEKLFGL